MKTAAAFIVRICLCFVLAGVAYFWATAIMDSLYAYRSPLRDDPPVAGQALDSGRTDPLTRRVVFVLIDGLREDTSLDEQTMPVLNRLRKQGAWATMRSRPPSFSAPGYTVLMSGGWPDISDGPPLNPASEPIPAWTQDNLFSAAKRTGLETAVSAYFWFESFIPEEAVSAGYFTIGDDQHADRQVVDAALPWLKDGGYQLVLIHIDQLDYAGHHEGGPGDPRWNEAARRADGLLGEILATLDLSRDTLLVCSDHGHIDQGGHGGQESVVLTEPFVLVGAGVRPGHYGEIQMVDVAPTLALLLGANLPASSQGKVLEEMLEIPSDLADALPGPLEAQQSQLLDVYQNAIGQTVEVEAGGDIVQRYQSALEAARQKRLSKERPPRAILGLVVAILPLAWLWRRPRREAAWLVGGGLLYVILFNLRYAVRDGHTYSLSSVESAQGLILYCAVTAALALLAGWLAAFQGLGGFRRSPREASLLALDFVLVTIYLVSLPAVWSFVWNGAVVTWTLPDFLSVFLGFLAMIQVLILAILGLALAGMAGLLAAIIRRRQAA